MRIFPVLVLVLVSPLIAQQKTNVPESGVQVTAQALLDRARRLSDIRAANGHAFRLDAAFSFMGKDLEPVHGSYTETWFSNSKWRREIVVNDFHRVEVGTTDRIWRLDSSADFSETAARITRLMNPFWSTQIPQFGSIQDGNNSQMTGQCAITLPGPQGQKGALCFDNKSGALVERADPEIRAKNAVVYSYFYGKFREFAGLLFPREMVCFEEAHHKFEAQVIGLSPPDSGDASAFVPPPGAKELGNCQGTLASPIMVYRTQPIFPREGGENSSVGLSFVINVHGRTQDITVAQSGGKAFDYQAVAAVQQWRFKPAACDGHPMPLEIELVLNFVR